MKKKLGIIIASLIMAVGMASPALGATSKSIGSDSVTFTSTLFSSSAKVGSTHYSTNLGQVTLKIPDHAVKTFRAGTKPTMEVKIYNTTGYYKYHVRTDYYFPLEHGNKYYSMYVSSYPKMGSNVALFAEYRSNYTARTFYPNWRD